MSWKAPSVPWLAALPTCQSHMHMNSADREPLGLLQGCTVTCLVPTATSGAAPHRLEEQNPDNAKPRGRHLLRCPNLLQGLHNLSPQLHFGLAHVLLFCSLNFNAQLHLAHGQLQIGTRRTS